MMMTQAGLVIALNVTPVSIHEKVDHKDENGFAFFIFSCQLLLGSAGKSPSNAHDSLVMLRIAWWTESTSQC